MKPSFVTAEDISPVFDEMVEVTLSSLHACKEATVEVARLKSELDSKDKVLLEKIASEPKSIFNDHEIDNTMNQLAALGFIEADSRQKIASELRKDPNKALALIGSIAELSTPMPSEGRSATKQASRDTYPGIPAHIARKYPKDMLEDGSWKMVEYGA